MTYPHSVNGVQLYITRLLSLPQFSPIFSLGKCTVTTVSVGEDCHCTVHSTNSQSLSLSVSDISVSSSCQSVRRLICLSASPAYPPSGSESQCSLVGIWHSVHMYTTKYRVLQARDQHSRHSRARQVQKQGDNRKYLPFCASCPLPTVDSHERGIGCVTVRLLTLAVCDVTVSQCTHIT